MAALNSRLSRSSTKRSPLKLYQRLCLVSPSKMTQGSVFTRTVYSVSQIKKNCLIFCFKNLFYKFGKFQKSSIKPIKSFFIFINLDMNKWTRFLVVRAFLTSAFPLITHHIWLHGDKGHSQSHSQLQKGMGYCCQPARRGGGMDTFKLG